MNLTKLFEAQKALRNRIAYNEPDRFNKLILALLVELSECANEQRSWKFWSKDQEPRILVEYAICKKCNGLGFLEDTKEDCPVPNCEDGELTKNPLLEEYVDGLHFVLEVGIEIAEEIQFDVSDYFKDVENEIKSQNQKSKNITDQFNYIAYLTTTAGYDFCFEYLFAAYYHLGEMLGFAWEEVETAYFDKNKVNHDRQDSGVY